MNSHRTTYVNTCIYVQPNEEANGQPQMMWSVDKQISKDLKSSSVIKTAWTIWQFILQTAKINCHWTKSLWNASMCSPTKKANGQPRMMWSVDKQTLKELTLNDMKVTGRSSVFCAIFFFICRTAHYYSVWLALRTISSVLP